jgi:hypothetical protein
MTTQSFKAIESLKLDAAITRVEKRVANLKNDAGLELDAKALAFQQSHSGVSYSDALKAVMEENVTLAKEFTDSFNPGKFLRSDVDDSDEVGKKIDDLVQRYINEHGGAGEMPYAKALDRVLEANPTLKSEWARTMKSTRTPADDAR